jgi:DNA-binding transcriptional MerR regulator
MDTVTYTIDQICEMTGVPRRTVRYYVEEGLLERPIGRGRGGNYLDSHVERLRKIKSLQEQGWTLSSIERHLKIRSTADALEVLSAAESSWQEKVDRLDSHVIERIVTPAPEEEAESRSLQAAANTGVRRTVRTAFLIARGSRSSSTGNRGGPVPQDPGDRPHRNHHSVREGVSHVQGEHRRIQPRDP